MEPGPDVVWLAHPSFRNLTSEEELVVCTYFQSPERSGGGEIIAYERLIDGRGDTSAVLIRFCDADCRLQVSFSMCFQNFSLTLKIFLILHCSFKNVSLAVDHNCVFHIFDHHTCN